MGADTPAEGGESKPKIKSEDNNVPSNAGRNNFRRNNNTSTVRKEKFTGAHADLQGHVFEAKRSRSEQVSNFRKVDELIKAKVGTEFDPFVLESLEKDTMTKPPEPTAVTANDGSPLVKWK